MNGRRNFSELRARMTQESRVRADTKADALAATRPFNAAAYLDSEEAAIAYLTDVLESNNNAFITHALDLIARDMAARPEALVALTPDLAGRIEALTAGLTVHPDEPIEGDVAL